MTHPLHPAAKVLPFAAVVVSSLMASPAEPPSTRAAFFAAWPKGAKPDAVIVLSGQTYGYLQPCGCSRPQIGGLERRATLFAEMKARGWAVTGFDLGDVLPVAAIVPEQSLLKYATAMTAMREMGYAAVGAGEAEFTNGLFRVLAEYHLRDERPPFLLAGNVGGLSGKQVTPRSEAFPGPGTRLMVGLAELVEVGEVRVGVVGVVGPSVAKAAEKLPNPRVGFTPAADAIAAGLKDLAARPKPPHLRVLLFQGSIEEAREVAKARPEFALVLCRSTDPDPPEPEAVGKSLVVRVGLKGRHVAAVGVFKRPDGTFDLKPQFVALGEDFVAPGPEAAARKANAALPALDAYAAQVRARNFLSKFPQTTHPAQAKDASLSYVGSDKCRSCHEAEHDAWKASKHAHAFHALEKQAKRPELRHLDGECAICHTVGLGYKTGYRDELTTPNLKHVGCEAWHGPRSGHAANPKDAKLLALQVPWRAGGGKLPAGGKGEGKVVAAVGRFCGGCHDTENDPHFDLGTHWPKVIHPTRKK